MKGRCQHKQEIVTQTTLGISYVTHSDGDPCALYNQFNTQGSDILLEQLKNYGFDETPATLAALSAQGKVKKYVIEQLETLQGEEFIRTLSIILKAYTAFNEPATYIKPLIHTFGLTMVENIHMLTGINYNYYIPQTLTKMTRICYSIQKDEALRMFKAKMKERDKLEKKIHAVLRHRR